MRWITNIFVFSSQQAEILEYLKSIAATPVFVNRALYQGLVETEFQVETLTPEFRKKVNDISFDAVDIVLETHEIPKYELDQGLRSIIRALVWEILKLEVVRITRLVIRQPTTKPSYWVTYSPYIKTTSGSQPIYLLESQSGFFRKTCRLSKYLGLEVYSQDPLTRYVLTTLEFPFDKVHQISSTILGPIAQKFRWLKTEVLTKVAIYRSDFHFYVPINNCSYDFTWLAPELAKMWQMEEIYQDTEGQVYRSQFDPGRDLEAWFHDSMLEIWRDRLPVVQVSAYDLQDDFQERNITNRLISLVKAIRAYSQVVTENPALTRAIFGVKVTDNELMQLPVTSQADRKTFMNSYVIESGTSLTWNVKIVKSLLEGILTRYLMQKEGLESFLFPVEGVEHVVYTDSDAGRIVADYNSGDYEAALVELRRDVLAVHKHCVNIEQLRKLPLLKLLTLIEVEDDPEAEIYCFPAEDLLDLNLPVNPITRVPLAEYTLAKARHIEFGIRGYFNIGILQGIYTMYPKRPTLTVTKAKITVKVIHELLSVCLDKNGLKEHLFDIMLPAAEAPILEQALNNLWRAGYLMSDWGQSLYRNFDQISAKSVRDWPILDRASDSELDGTLALIFIQRAEHELS